MMRLFGPPEIDRLEAKGKINGLLKALQHDDAEIRRQAAAALGRLGDRRAVELLTAALADSAAPVIVESIRALGRIGDQRSTSPLIEVLNKPNSRSWLVGRTDNERRSAAAEALGHIGDQDALEALVGCLVDDTPVRAAAATALAELGWHPTNVADEVSYCVATQNLTRCVELGEDAVGSLLGVLEGRRSRSDRAFAAGALGKMGTAQAVEPLKSSYHRATDPRVRAEIITALGEIGDPAAIDVLVAALSGTRVEAVDALKKIGAHSIQPLVACLDRGRVSGVAAELLDHFSWCPENPSEGVAYRLAKHDVEGCVEIGPGAEPALINRLKRGYDGAAIEALAKIGGLDALEPLAAHRNLRWDARNAFDVVAVRAAAGRPLDDPRLELVLETLRAQTVEPDRWTRGVDDDYKHFDDGWATQGSGGFTAAANTGERLVASSLSGGGIDRLSHDDVSAHTGDLLHCLTIGLDWHTKGLIAALLVESGVGAEDPRLRDTIEDLRAWAEKADEDEEIEPMVMETRRYEHQRVAAGRILERLT